MWIVEVNVLGRRFTHRFADRSDALRLNPLVAPWRQWKQRPPRDVAAA
jgi:hypothetical protein